MIGKSIIVLVLIEVSLLVSGCTPIAETTTEVNPVSPEIKITQSPIPPSALPTIQLAKTDEVIFAIPNREPFSGKEGEPRPDWLGWGAETFTVAPDGSFWIADTAVAPNRLLHYNRQGMLLLDVSLENRAVYTYDLAITQDSLWILDVSAQQPTIVQLDMDGQPQSTENIPREIMTYDGQFVSNGAGNIFVGDEGELLLDSVTGYYEIVDASGKITFQPLEVLTYYGHTYRRGIYDEATNRLPIFVDEDPFEISDFLVYGDLFLGFNPDGSFAIAAYAHVDEPAIDEAQVRYYNASGELLGIARQRPQTFYKDFNHHLAFGPDGSIYQLLSNPDHSVQILRLGFFEELYSEELPSLTPTPLTALLPCESATTDEERARNVLLKFFADLSAGNYAEAAALYGGEVNEYAREPLPGETIDAYWEYMCGFLWCLPIADITQTEQVSENEFIFHVVFMHKDGTRFQMGACCGGDPAASPPVWQFAYPVQKIDGKWKVMRGPLFTP